MNVSLVITCWNGRKLLEKNLPSVIKASQNPKNRIKEIIVVDDGSTDDSVKFIEKVKSQKSKLKIKLVKHDKNYGYAKTCNTGVREAVNDLVVILNLDVVPNIDFLEEALPHFEDKKVFAVSFNEGKFGPGKLVWKNGFLEIEKTNIPQKATLTDWPSGGSSIFRKKIWEKLGGMDELFLPFYFEDVDLGVRAKKAGFKCLWEPKAKVEHQHEGTINPKNFSQEYINSIKQRNHLLLTWKNLQNIKLFIFHLFFLLEKCLFHPKYLKAVFLSFKKYFLI